jgi:glycine cleavage system H lipoate-binding protein
LNFKYFLSNFQNKVSGKGKKGGQSLDEKSILFYINCESGERYPVRSCVRGKLISLNQKIVENPSLIFNKSLGQSHLATILTKIPGNKNCPTKKYYDKNIQKIIFLNSKKRKS